MTVERISGEALEKLIKGKINEETTCVIKFYSNGCHLCHALKKSYEEISDQYEDVHFFAFNTEDHLNLDSILPINGTPSICLINTGRRKNIITLVDPTEPDNTTWFTSAQIKNFIDKEKR